MIATPVLVVLSVAISILMAFDPPVGAHAEWWRLAATPFVHLRVLGLFVSAVGLLRAAALHKSDMTGLQQADSKEQASMQAFHRLTPRRAVDGS